jgi:hypothetical protein
MHPDEYRLPGVTLDLDAYHRGAAPRELREKKPRAKAKSQT